MVQHFSLFESYGFLFFVLIWAVHFLPLLQTVSIRRCRHKGFFFLYSTSSRWFDSTHCWQFLDYSFFALWWICFKVCFLAGNLALGATRGLTITEAMEKGNLCIYRKQKGFSITPRQFVQPLLCCFVILYLFVHVCLDVHNFMDSLVSCASFCRPLKCIFSPFRSFEW